MTFRQASTEARDGTPDWVGDNPSGAPLPQSRPHVCWNVAYAGPSVCICEHCVRLAQEVIAERPVLDAELGIDEQARLIAMVAQYIPRKGHRVLFDALPAVIAQHPDVLVLCCGSGPQEEALQKEIATRGLQDNVRMLGFRDDLEKILPCCELSLHPALTEGICGAALQAQSCSVATIGSRVGGLPEAISDGVTGLLVEPGNSGELADTINRLLGDDALRIRLAEAGPGYVGERFSIAAMVRDNLAVYREVLA